MAQRVCETCGKRYAPRSPRQRFHSEACRKRAARAAAKDVRNDRHVPDTGPVTEATIRELTEVGLVERASAQGVIAIARRLDEAGVGPSAATLNREHRAAMAALLASVPPAPDRVDAIGERRLRVVG